jgi:hypothetical protein
LVRQLLAGGVPGPGVVVEGITEAFKAFKAAHNRQKRRKTGRFYACFGLKIAENAIFPSKVLNKIYPRGIF